MPLAYRYNVPGEHLANAPEEAPFFAPGPVSQLPSRVRLSDEVLTMTPNEPMIERHNNPQQPIAVGPQAAPDPIVRSAFAAEFTGNGRAARNPLTAWTYFPGGSPEGHGGWQEDRFIRSFGAAHREFYPQTEFRDAPTFDYSSADQRRNVPYDRSQSYGEQVQDASGALYQDLSGRGGY